MRAGIGLVGRDAELAELEQFLDGPGRGALAVRGDAGVGKTALISEFCARAAAGGWRVLRAIGVEAERPFSLGGLNQMVYPLRALLADLAPHDRDALAPVFGADPVHAPSPVPLAIAVLELLGVAATAQPVLIVVDDVQWLDEISAAVLSAAGRRVGNPRVRVLASCRPHSGAEFSTAGWDELDLRPLSIRDAALVVDRMKLPLSVVARQAILDVAAGNPLALEELPRCADQIDSWTASLPLTDRLVAVFGGRLAALDASVRTELLRAALDGTKSLGTPAVPTDNAARYVMAGVQSAIDQDLLTTDPLGDIVFRHPLVRAAVIHQAGPQDRRDAHAHLAALYDDVLVRRATHLSAASTGPDQAVADLLDQAARSSIRRGGAAVAVDWLRRAGELSSDPGRRATLRADAAFVAAQAARFDDAQTLVDAASGEESESVSAVATAAYLALYRDGEAVSGHRRVLTALRGHSGLDDATVSRLLKLLFVIDMYSGDAELWSQTEAVVDALADRLDEVASIYRDAFGDTARRGHTVSVRLADRAGTLSALEPWEVMRLSVAAYYVDALADFRTTLQRLFNRERDRGAVTNAMTMLHLLTLDQISAGRWEQAQESAREGLELTTTHRNDLFGCQFTAYDGLRAACQGDDATARRCAAEVVAWAGPRRLGLLLAFVDRITVLLALGAADYDAAYVAALRICPPGEFPPYAHHAIESLLDFVEAAVHTGHHEQARAHVAEATRLRLGDISPRLDALTMAVTAMTSPDEQAGARYDAALSHPALVAFPFDHARIILAQGMWLRRQRRNTEARDALTHAAELFTDLGAAPWAQRAHGELRASGAGVKRAAGDSVTLSAQERRIAELAAAGQSNKQIAAALYLSPRTVGAHLYRIFPKLGVTSRAGLGHALTALLPNEADPV